MAVYAKGMQMAGSEMALPEGKKIADNSDMKSEINFRVTYDGPALQAHDMDVRELAPALLALADLLKAANEDMFGDKADVRVSVRAGFKEGSFGIEMVFFQDLFTQLTELFTGKEASAAANAFTIISGIGLLGGGGVIGALRWLRGRRIERIENRQDLAVIHTQDESLEIDLATLRLLKNKRLRTELRNVLRPLDAEGIDSVSITRGSAIGETILRGELDYFSPRSDEDEPLSDSTTRGVILQIESAVFKEGNKWRFTDGSRSFYAAIEDPDFLARIASGEERFGKADMLVVDLRQIQYAANGELKSEWRILRVTEHRAPLQPPLI